MRLQEVVSVSPAILGGGSALRLTMMLSCGHAHVVETREVAGVAYDTLFCAVRLLVNGVFRCCRECPDEPAQLGYAYGPPAAPPPPAPPEAVAKTAKRPL